MPEIGTTDAKYNKLTVCHKQQNWA